MVSAGKPLLGRKKMFQTAGPDRRVIATAMATDLSEIENILYVPPKKPGTVWTCLPVWFQHRDNISNANLIDGEAAKAVSIAACSKHALPTRYGLGGFYCPLSNLDVGVCRSPKGWDLSASTSLENRIAAISDDFPNLMSPLPRAC